MRDIRKELVEMLKAEVKPAVGCTEPVALALCKGKGIIRRRNSRKSYVS